MAGLFLPDHSPLATALCKWDCDPGWKARRTIRSATSSNSILSPTVIEYTWRRRAHDLNQLSRARPRGSCVWRARPGLAQLVSLLPVGGLARRPLRPHRAIGPAATAAMGRGSARHDRPPRTHESH